MAGTSATAPIVARANAPRRKTAIPISSDSSTFSALTSAHIAPGRGNQLRTDIGASGSTSERSCAAVLHFGDDRADVVVAPPAGAAWTSASAASWAFAAVYRIRTDRPGRHPGQSVRARSAPVAASSGRVVRDRHRPQGGHRRLRVTVMWRMGCTAASSAAKHAERDRVLNFRHGRSSPAGTRHRAPARTRGRRRECHPDCRRQGGETPVEKRAIRAGRAATPSHRRLASSMDATTSPASSSTG